MTLETAVAKAQALAEAIKDYWETELPKRNPRYPFVDPNANSVPPPPEEKRLRQFLTRLRVDTLYKLALVMFLGTGGCKPENVSTKFQELQEDFKSPSSLIAFLMEQISLAYYLELGMEVLKSQHGDLNAMDLSIAEA
jgi:hypothetical protein